VSAYTIKNLMEIDDSAGDNAPNVEARFGRRHLDSQHLGVSYFRYAPGFHPSGGHSHREQEEAYVVVGGSGRVKLDDEIVDVEALDAIRVAPGVIRAWEAGPDGIEVLAVSPRRDDDPGELFHGWWAG